MNFSVYCEMNKAYAADITNWEKETQNFDISRFDHSIIPFVLASLRIRKKELFSIFYWLNLDDGQEWDNKVCPSNTQNPVEMGFIERYKSAAIPYLVNEYSFCQDQNQNEKGFRYVLILLMQTACGKGAPETEASLATEKLLESKAKVKSWKESWFSALRPKCFQPDLDSLKYIQKHMNIANPSLSALWGKWPLGSNGTKTLLRNFTTL